MLRSCNLNEKVHNQGSGAKPNGLFTHSIDSKAWTVLGCKFTVNGKWHCSLALASDTEIPVALQRKVSKSYANVF